MLDFFDRRPWVLYLGIGIADLAILFVFILGIVKLIGWIF